MILSQTRTAHSFNFELTLTICKGNLMTSSAIWDKSARVNSQRLIKLYEPVGRVQFVVLKNLRALIYPKLYEKNHVISSK